MANKPIYICVTPFFPSPTTWQGAYVLDQVKAIQRNSDFEVVVFKYSGATQSPSQYEFDGVNVYTFPVWSTPSYMFNGLFNRHNGRSFVKAVKAVGIDLPRIRYVHTHTGPFAVYGLALKKEAPHIKVFVQHHDPDPFTIRNGKWAQWKLNACYRAKNSIRLFNEVDLHICISEFVRDNLLSFPSPRKGETYESYIKALNCVKSMPSIKPKDVYVLYNGVDTALFDKQEKKCTNLFRIGSIGNFVDWKDHITLIRAFHILLQNGYTNMRLSLLGTGPTREMCEKYVNDNNIQDYVEWPSEVHHDQLPAYYQSLDLFVLPSYFEGFGCVFTEAYASGVPFMGCYNQGAAECIAPEERDKWLIQPHDYEQLAKNIECFYSNRDKQKLSKDYDIDKLIKDFIHYIEKI